jgi:TonB family protein
MAHHPTFPPDPSEHPRRGEGASSSPVSRADWIDEGDFLHLAELTATLASHGGGTYSADLALDLMLNEIVEQARLATTATGAAIALVRDDEMVCRATTGASAPGLGVRLSTRTGLSGACVQSRQVQRCDDAEIDPRVDAASYRGLEVRSILMLPVLDGEEVTGVFQILSPRPNAFGQRDIQTLQALSRHILDNIKSAAEVSSAPALTESSPSPAVPELDKIAAELSPPQVSSRVARPRSRPRDRWTDLLNATVVALALLLGWMLGRAEWQRVAGRQRQPNSTSAQRPARASQKPINPQSAASTQGTGEKRRDSARPEPSKPSGTKAQPKVSAASDLVVYERGKVVFRMGPAQRPAQTSIRSVPDTISPEIAKDYLIQRVEPQYPEVARSQHIQGPVTLDVVVDEEGKVQNVKVFSGDSALAPAAVDAVQRWRFKPYLVNGRASQFTTQITVNFVLP